MLPGNFDALLTKREVDPAVSRAEFLEDLECLHQLLRDCYGAYDYFGRDRFCAAFDAARREIEAGAWAFSDAVEAVRKHLGSVVRDGHFSVGEAAAGNRPEYTVRFSELNGVPVIDCKKFWYDTEAERLALEAFVKSAEQFRNDDPLIIDLRDNPGGSDVYIYEFLRGLFGVEPSYPCKFIQRNSPLFLAYLAKGGIEPLSKEDPQVEEEDGLSIQSGKPIYVLFNGNTCSSGESAIAYLKTVTGAVLVGDHSGGAFSCGNCVQVYLPKSHLPVYFGTGLILYEKTQNIDAEGGFRGEISMEEFQKQLRS